jgi:hypothetical protein
LIGITAQRPAGYFFLAYKGKYRSAPARLTMDRLWGASSYPRLAANLRESGHDASHPGSYEDDAPSVCAHFITRVHPPRAQRLGRLLSFDSKGLYARARKGGIEQMTGISSPYEAPETPEIRVETLGREVADVVHEIRLLIDEVVRRAGAAHQ